MSVARRANLIGGHLRGLAPLLERPEVPDVQREPAAGEVTGDRFEIGAQELCVEHGGNLAR